VARTWGLAAWCFLAWLMLSLSVSVESLVTGLVLSVGAAAALSGLGEVPGPWSLLRPRRLGPLLHLVGRLAVDSTRANVQMAWRVWTPRPQLRTGMVVVGTLVRTDGQVGTVGLLTSLVVDNQVVDVDLDERTMLYHCVEVPRGDAYDVVNGPVERRLLGIADGA
jgi:multicomponent Na+:H+ antiporter subunit E